MNQSTALKTSMDNLAQTLRDLGRAVDMTPSTLDVESVKALRASHQALMGHFRDIHTRLSQDLNMVSVKTEPDMHLV